MLNEDCVDEAWRFATLLNHDTIIVMRDVLLKNSCFPYRDMKTLITLLNNKLSLSHDAASFKDFKEIHALAHSVS